MNIIDKTGKMLLKDNYDQAWITTQGEIASFNNPGKGQKTTIFYYFDLKGNLLRQEEVPYHG